MSQFVWMNAIILASLSAVIYILARLFFEVRQGEESDGAKNTWDELENNNDIYGIVSKYCHQNDIGGKSYKYSLVVLLLMTSILTLIVYISMLDMHQNVMCIYYVLVPIAILMGVWLVYGAKPSFQEYIGFFIIIVGIIIISVKTGDKNEEDNTVEESIDNSPE